MTPHQQYERGLITFKEFYIMTFSEVLKIGVDKFRKDKMHGLRFCVQSLCMRTLITNVYNKLVEEKEITPIENLQPNEKHELAAKCEGYDLKPAARVLHTLNNLIVEV